MKKKNGKMERKLHKIHHIFHQATYSKKSILIAKSLVSNSSKNWTIYNIHDITSSIHFSLLQKILIQIEFLSLHASLFIRVNLSSNWSQCSDWKTENIRYVQNLTESKKYSKKQNWATSNGPPNTW